MQSIDFEEEDQILSEGNKQQKQIKRFKEYLVNSGTIHHFAKFLFGLRSKQQHDQSVPNTDALEMFRQYFGALKPDTTEQDAIKDQIQAAKTEKQQLTKQLEEIQREIKEKKENIAKALEQKRLREQQQAKNPKKGGKK